jgi:hypothetical protein
MPVRQLTVYSRPGCHLCERLIEDLEPLCRSHSVQLRVMDVDSRVEWARRYGDRIPVVCDGEDEISGCPLDREAVLAWLAVSHS